jgi:hypothetical protein
MTASTASWWPAFLPVRPLTGLATTARVESDGRFQVRLAGQYGWSFPAGRQPMVGASFDLTEQSMTLTGTIMADSATELRVGGRVTAASTTLTVVPPQALLDQISKDVNARVLPQISTAQKAWDDLQKATADYEFELSLRGVRRLIPGIVDVSKQGITTGINSALSEHEGRFYYGALRGLVNSFAQPYYDQLDSLKVRAARGDNAATRAALEQALRAVAANKVLRFSHTVSVLGQVLWSASFERRIMSDAQANQLILAADNIDRIPATSNVMISMRQIYDRIPTKQIFEQVRDDINDGVLRMVRIDEMGMVVSHAAQPTFSLYARMGGRRYELGAIPALTIATLAVRFPDAMITALRSN